MIHDPVQKINPRKLGTRMNIEKTLSSMVL